ncbi:Phage portal protein [Pediococcus damnosus]|uniref:phage portal protein n=1 Tax=Pediococcus damnosus TaxID=51663 RepID=UPI00078B9E3B|nr:phage portal protein [Pediococcus damnosus]AMV60121.1 Phage portal protein [Pediococcus damnosus]AMV64365.1 Phage portal protein [Pediococcus damnosus]
MNLFNLNNNEEPDKDTAFLDALVSMQSDDSAVYVGAGALRNNDVMSAIRVIASDIASNPIQGTNDKTVKLLNENPNPQMNGFNFKFALACNLLLNGNSFAEIIRDNNGRPTQLNLIKNSEMTVKQDDQSGIVTYNYKQNRFNSRQIAPVNILHFKYFTQDGIVGVSPLYALKDQIQEQKSGNKLLRSFFGNGINGTSVLKLHKTDLSEDAKANIKNKFEKANAGNASAVVIDDSMDLSNLEINSDLLSMVNSNSDWSSRQIAEAFNIPVERLATENSHSSNEQSNVLYLQNSLSNYFAVFTSEINSKLAGTYTFNTDKLFSADPETNQDLAIKGYQAGLLTVNEARGKIGLAPIDNGDQLLINTDYIPLNDMAKNKNLVSTAPIAPTEEGTN